MNEAYKDVRRLKMTLKTLEITWAEACCPPYTDANVGGKRSVSFLNFLSTTLERPIYEGFRTLARQIEIFLYAGE